MTASAVRCASAVGAAMINCFEGELVTRIFSTRAAIQRAFEDTAHGCVAALWATA
jgi:hypothetical protein